MALINIAIPKTDVTVLLHIGIHGGASGFLYTISYTHQYNHVTININIINIYVHGQLHIVDSNPDFAMLVSFNSVYII